LESFLSAGDLKGHGGGRGGNGEASHPNASTKKSPKILDFFTWGRQGRHFEGFSFFPSPFPPPKKEVTDTPSKKIKK
jgi:hypothetical protein